MAQVNEMTTIFSGKQRKVRTPRLQRAVEEDRPPLRLMPRDEAVVAAVYRYRALTSRQIEALFWGTPLHSTRPINSRCSYRLQLLFQHGFLHRNERPQLLDQGRLPLVYHLDDRGAQWLARRWDCEVTDLDWHPKRKQVGHLFLDHLLATNDVRVSLVVAAGRHGFTIETWLDDATLKRRPDYVTVSGPQGGRKRTAVIPDGYFTLAQGNQLGHLFLEVDRRTVTGESALSNKRDWKRRIRGYLEYYASGQYQSRYQTRSLRVLVVTTGEKRLANLKAITEKAGGRSRFWYATFQRLQAGDGLTDPVWSIAGREGRHSLVKFEDPS